MNNPYVPQQQQQQAQGSFYGNGGNQGRGGQCQRQPPVNMSNGGVQAPEGFVSQNFMNNMHNQQNRPGPFANGNGYPASNYINDNQHVFDTMFMGNLKEDYTTGDSVNAEVQRVSGTVQKFVDTDSRNDSFADLEEFSFGSFDEIYHFDSDESVDSGYVIIDNTSISNDSTESISSMPELEERILIETSSDNESESIAESMPPLTKHYRNDTSTDDDDDDDDTMPGLCERYREDSSSDEDSIESVKEILAPLSSRFPRNRSRILYDFNAQTEIELNRLFRMGIFFIHP